MPTPTSEFEVWVAVDDRGRHVADVSRIDAAVSYEERVARGGPGRRPRLRYVRLVVALPRGGRPTVRVARPEPEPVA